MLPDTNLLGIAVLVVVGAAYVVSVMARAHAK